MLLSEGAGHAPGDAATFDGLSWQVNGKDTKLASTKTMLQHPSAAHDAAQNLSMM